MPRLCRCVAAFSASVASRRQDLQRLHRAARRPGAGGADQHQDLGARAGVPDHIAGDQPTHGESRDRKARLRPDDGSPRPAANVAPMLSAEIGAGGVAGFAGSRKVRNQQHEIARQRLDVAHPMHPAAGAAMQQNQRRAVAPYPPHHLAGPIGGGAARARAIERGDEFRQGLVVKWSCDDSRCAPRSDADVSVPTASSSGA